MPGTSSASESAVGRSSSSSSDAVSSEMEIEFSRDPILHLLNVLKASAEDSPYRMALEDLGATGLIEFLEMSDADFTRCHHLNLAQAKNLIAVRDWAVANSCFDPDSFAQLTPNGLREFRTSRIANRLPSVHVPAPAAASVSADATASDPVGVVDPAASSAPAPAPVPVPAAAPVPSPAPVVATAGPTASPVVSTASAASSGALESFKKGVKRDATAYPKFQDKKHFALWDRQFRAIASSQGVDCALDPDYVPAAGDEAAVFWEIKKFIHTALTLCVHETTGVTIVREYSSKHSADMGDGQKAYAALCKEFASGAAASSARSIAESQLESLRLDKSFNKPICTFLALFAHKVLDLQELRADGDTTSYGDHWCKERLRRALLPHEAMSRYADSISALEDTTSRLGLPTTTYQQFLSQLKIHAESLDLQAKSRRQANNTNSSNGNQPSRNGNGNGNGGRGSGGRGNGRQGGNGRGGRGNDSNRRSSSNGNHDPTDPSVYLSQDEYKALSAEQKAKRYQRKHGQLPPNTPTRRVNQSSQGRSNGETPSQSVASPMQYSDNSTIASGSTPPPTFIRQLMSSHQARPPVAQSAPQSSQPSDDFISVNGTVYRRASATHLYRVHESARHVHGALIDGGANGGLLGSDARVLETHLTATANVEGVTHDVLENLPIVQAAAKLDTLDDGAVIAIFSSYALRSDGGRTIHCKSQMESFGLIVDDRAQSNGGKQCIVTTEGYVVPLHIRDGLPYLDMTAPTDDDLERYPHVFFTADTPWDPSVLDQEFSAPDFELPSVALARRDALDGRVDEYGELRYAHQTITAFPQTVRPRLPDLDFLKPHFMWVPNERIKATLDATTQYYRATVHHPFRKHFRSRFPAANVRRLPEWFSTDTIFSETPAHDDGIPGHGGCQMLQLFGGMESKFLAGYPLRSESDIPAVYQDFLREVGAPVGLKSDNAKAEIYGKVLDLNRLYCVKDKQSEAYYEHQNPIERMIQDVKRLSNSIMDRMAVPAKFWLLTMLFVIGLSNCLVNVNGVIPHSVVTGEVTDVSPYLSFHFWQEVFYEDSKNGGELLGRWCGPASKKGDFLTYWILTNDTEQLIARSNVRAAKDPMFPNRRARPLDSSLAAGGEGDAPSDQAPIIFSAADRLGLADPTALEVPKFSPDELLGLSFLRETDTGERFRAKITRKILDRDAQDHQAIKFLISIGDGELEEIISYNELSDIVEQQHKAEADGELDTWAYESILDHEGPLRPGMANYKGSAYNVLIEWADGSKTWEPINLIGKTDKFTLAAYAREHDLLDTPGWKFLQSAARRDKRLKRMVNQARRASHHNAIRYKFGVQIPRTVKEAYALDIANGNTKWADAIETELLQLNEYKTFIDHGVGKPLPPGYKMIRCHIIFDCKEDGRRKARLVGGGHLTAPPKDSVYSSVASLRSIRLVTFLSQLNGLELCAADVGNAYLEAYTKEKVAFVAGKEFGPLAGHTLLISKALYGLRSSGARFHDKFADTLTDMGFKPSLCDPDVWYRDAGDCYEYVCTYVDDLLVAMKDPNSFMKALQAEPYNYKLKGVGPPRYHLGGDFFQDPDGTLCYGCQTYIRRLADTYKQLFGEDPKTNGKRPITPMTKGDQPELDSSEPCTDAETIQFQSLIGALQWTISLSRFDIAHAVMTLSRYRTSPFVGHLDRAKQIVRYLCKYSQGAIRYRTGIPNYEAIYGEQPESHEWMHSVYGNPVEDVPDGMFPEPKGKPVRTSTFVDANLMHDLTTGRSCTGVLHLLNQTPIDWFSKRQNQVETATYGSEFMAARQATEQIMDLRFTLRALGVPIDGPSWLFGDNQSVVTSSTIPHSKLSKRWNALSYHRVREAIAANVIRFHYVRSEENPADILTKALDFTTTWSHVEPMLFWKGDTVVPQSSPLYNDVSGPTAQAPRGVTNGSALMPYREVDALALVTNSAGLQARPENTYVGPPGPYVQVLNSNLCSDPARAYPEHTYGTYGTNGDSSPMSEEIAFRIW